MVLGDRDELTRVFENLIENALKYAASGKRVDIMLSIGEAAKSAREASVRVRDYGPGIAPEHLPRLTERFYRVDVSESRAQGGTGLGLALAKHILNRHGGRLTIESSAGQGATFTAHLPAAEANTAESRRDERRLRAMTREGNRLTQTRLRHRRLGRVKPKQYQRVVASSNCHRSIIER